MEDYHPIMGLWGDIIQYQFSSQSCMSVLTQRANNVPGNWGFEHQRTFGDAEEAQHPVLA
eukprot:13083759-Ditylum_brightwellii.AAC.1